MGAENIHLWPAIIKSILLEHVWLLNKSNLGQAKSSSQAWRSHSRREKEKCSRRKRVKQTFWIKKTHTFTRIASNFVPKQLITRKCLNNWATIKWNWNQLSYNQNLFPSSFPIFSPKNYKWENKYAWTETRIYLVYHKHKTDSTILSEFANKCTCI